MKYLIKNYSNNLIKDLFSTVNIKEWYQFTLSDFQYLFLIKCLDFTSLFIFPQNIQGIKNILFIIKFIQMLM